MWERAEEWVHGKRSWWQSGKLYFDSFCHISSLKTSFCLLKLSIFDMKPARHNKNTLEGVFCIYTPWSCSGFIWCLFADWVPLAEGKAPTSSWEGWVRTCESIGWWCSVLLCFPARHSVHGSRATPHALPCSAVYICNVFNNDSIRKLQQYCQLFQVCVCRVFVCIPCAPGFCIAYKIFLHYHFEPGLLLSNQYWGEEEGRKKRKRLGTSTFAIHECSCH